MTDFNDLVKQALTEMAQERATSGGSEGVPAAPAPQSQAITVNIGGKPVTFRDQADLEAQLNSTAAAIQQLQAQSQQPTDNPQGSRVTDDEGTRDKFSNDEYIRLMNEDPRKATNYVLSHELFGGQVEDATSVIRESLIETAKVNRKLAAYEFKDAHREVPVEDPRVGNVIENVRKQLGMSFTAEGLEAAYAFSIQKGYLPDFRAVAQAQQNQQAAAQVDPNQQYQQNQYLNGTGLYGSLPGLQQASTNPYLAPPPAPGRSTSASVPMQNQDIEDMSTEQLQKLLLKLGGMGA